MHLIARIPVVLLAVAGLAQAGGAQEPPPDTAPPQEQEPVRAEEQPTFRTGINFVRVDVIVSDRDGAPVADLTADDFEVLEDGTPQTIEQFRLVEVDGNPDPGDGPPRQIRSQYDEEMEAARDDVRVFVIFFDDYHTRIGSALGVKGPLTRFVQQQLGPNDLVAVMYPLTPLDAVSLTRNHDAVVSAIEKFEGRKFRYEPRNDFEARYANYPAEVVERIRNEVVMTALRGLATRLGSLREGRKAIIFVSEGFTAMLPPQKRDPIATLPGIGNPNARDPFAGENNAREESMQFFAEADLISQMRDVWDAANRNNAAIYALDPRGLAGSEYGVEDTINIRTGLRNLQSSQDTLRTLSSETDGRAIVNRNDLSNGLQQVVQDSSAYYLIGYNSSQAPDDGEFHEIDVRVKRRGVQVRARKGYWAPTKDDTARAIAGPKAGPPKEVQEALASIAMPGGRSGAGSRAVRTWVGTSRAENGRTRVTFVWEPAPPAPGVRAQQQPGRVSLLAASREGDIVFRGRVPDAAVASAAPASGGAAGRAAGPQRVVFDAAPGAMELRISVEAAGSGDVIDSEIRELTVPDLTGPGLSTPRVYRARTALEFRAAAGDADAVPAATREFLRRERLLIRFDAYGPEEPSAALLNRSGQKMADLPVAPAAAGGTHQIDFGLGSVPPGEYLVEISVGAAKELVPLKVGS